MAGARADEMVGSMAVYMAVGWAVVTVVDSDATMVELMAAS